MKDSMKDSLLDAGERLAFISQQQRKEHSMENRTDTSASHLYDYQFDWNTAHIEEMGTHGRGYEVRIPCTSTTDTNVVFLLAKRLDDGKAVVRFLDAERNPLAFRFDDAIARAFVAQVEDEFLAAEAGRDALVEREAYRNRLIRCTTCKRNLTSLVDGEPDPHPILAASFGPWEGCDHCSSSGWLKTGTCITNKCCNGGV